MPFISENAVRLSSADQTQVAATLESQIRAIEQQRKAPEETGLGSTARGDSTWSRFSKDGAPMAHFDRRWGRTGGQVRPPKALEGSGIEAGGASARPLARRVFNSVLF
jgi:hypothetical protein